MAILKGWVNLAGLRKAGTTAWETALANPRQVGIGAAAGGLFGLTTSNEGRGPISSTLFWGTVGASAGMASLAAAGPLREMAAQGREVLSHLKNAPSPNAPEFKAWAAQAAASRNPGMSSINANYRGFLGTPDSYIAREPKLTNPQMVEKIHGFLRGKFGITSTGPLTGAELAAVSPNVPGWMKSVVGVASDLKLPNLRRPEGLRITGGNTFSKATNALGWNDVLQNIGDTSGDPELQGKFLSGITSRLGKYSENWGESLSPGDLGFKRSTAEPVFEKSFKTITGRLEQQGQRRIARWLRVLQAKQGNHFKISGQYRPDLNPGMIASQPIVSIRIEPMDRKLKDLSGELVRAIELDIPDMNGMIRHGHFGQNVHIPRSVADVQAISTLLNGRVNKSGRALAMSNVSARIQDPASFVLKNLASSFNTGEGTESIGWLRRVYNRARNWESDPYRADRSGLTSNLTSRKGLPLSWELRKRSAIMALPTDESGKPIQSLLAQQGFREGAASPLDFMGNLQGTKITDFFERSGRFMTASENQARQATMSDTGFLLGLDPGMIENPLSKPSIVERDVAKMYNLAFNEAAPDIGRARLVSRVPFATKALRNMVDASEQGYLMGTHPVFESEIQQARKIAFQMNRRNVSRMFVAAGIDRSKFDLLHRSLAQIGQLNEGIIGADVPSAIEMGSTRKIEFDLLNSKLLGGRDVQSLVGQELGTSDFIGIDLETGEMLGHTYSGKRQGRAFIREIRSGTRLEKDAAGKPTGREKERFFATIEERISGEEAKVGHLTGKNFIKNLEQDAKNVLAQWFDYNRQRTGRGFSKMYGSQTFIPIFGNIRGSEAAVTAFAAQSTMYKYQNRMQILLNNLMVRHLPSMHEIGQAKTIRLLKRYGITVNRLEDNTFEGTLHGTAGKTMQQYEQMFGRLFNNESKRGGMLKRLFTSMYSRPRAYFGDAKNSLTQFVRGGTAGGGNTFEDIMTREFMGGIYGQAKMWDALRLNVPGQASITMHEMFALKQYGMTHAYNELVSRGRRTGDAAITTKFHAAMAEQADNLGHISDEAAARIGINVKNLDDVEIISGIRTKGFIETGRPSSGWRAGFEDNFIIDLKTAHNKMTEATDAIQKALGTTRIVVPGTKSDFWNEPFFTPKGTAVTTEKFAPHLEKLLEAASIYHKYAPGTEAAERQLGIMQHHMKAYHNAINTATKIAYSGRGSSIQDATNLWTTGRLTFRPYRSIFKNLDPTIASRIMGVEPREYGRLSRSLMKESGAKNIGELIQMGRAKQLGGYTFLVGENIRYPITDVSAALITMDPGLRRSGGIGMEETYRAMKNADFDGDSLVARVFKEEGSVAELFGSITDPNSPIFKRYSAFQRVSDIFGGVGQDISRTSQAGISPDLYSSFMKRHEKFGLMRSQSLAERLGKMWTQNVGRYSNLAGTMGFMSDVEGLSDMERAMRSKIANQLQQISIDFGRAASATGAALEDPNLLQKAVAEALEMAAKAPASAKGGANQIMAQVFEDLGLHREFREQGAAARRAGIRTTRAERGMLSDLMQNFFSRRDEYGNLVDLDRGQMASRGELMDSLLKRGLREEDLSDAMASHYRDIQVRAAAGEEGLMNIPGHMPRSADMISKENAFYKQVAKSAGHILLEGFKKFRANPKAGIAGGILAGAGVAAAVIGIMSSPTKFDSPDFSGGGDGGRAIMRSPDRAMAGSDGEAPLPGGRGGQVSSRMGPERVPKYNKGVHMQQKRFYYDQSNRVPRTTNYSATSPEEAQAQSEQINSDIRRNSNRGSSTSVNIVNSPNARRYSRSEMRSRVSDDLYR